MIFFHQLTKLIFDHLLSWILFNSADGITLSYIAIVWGQEIQCNTFYFQIVGPSWLHNYEGPLLPK